MAKIKLTKTELKAQSDALKRYQRFLPMLQLKKQQLQAEIAGIVAKADAVAKRFAIPETVRLPIDPSFASSVDAGAAELIEIPAFEAFADRILRSPCAGQPPHAERS